MRPDVYRRPNKPARLLLRDRRADRIDTRGAAQAAPALPVAVDAATECHVTPPAVAAFMAAALGDAIRGALLEPSAGTGALVQAAIKAGADPAHIFAVERHVGLADALSRRFPSLDVRATDFLDCKWPEVVGRRFDAVLMNPPFSKARAHVAAARDTLAPGGVLVALVPATFDETGAEALEHLGPDTFATARVHSKIIRSVAP